MGGIVSEGGEACQPRTLHRIDRVKIFLVWPLIENKTWYISSIPLSQFSHLHTERRTAL